MSDEQCDDSLKDDGKGCKPDCSGVLDGWYCNGGDKDTKDTCHTECDDGILIPSEEECSDTNLDDGDGCSSTCTEELGFTCDQAEPVSLCVTECGDGHRVGGEVCDDGDDEDNQGC